MSEYVPLEDIIDTKYTLDRKDRGFFAIGVENHQFDINLGVLFRSAVIYGADFIFTVGNKYERQRSDTTDSNRYVPCFNFTDYADLRSHLPNNSDLIGIEMDRRSIMVNEFKHPPRGIYLLGAEKEGLSRKAREECRYLIQMPGEVSMNVAMAGTIVMHDRWTKGQTK